DLAVPLSARANDSQIRRAEAVVRGSTIGLDVSKSLLKERQHTMDSRRAAVGTVRADLAAAEIEVEKTTRKQDRANALFKESLVSQQDLEDAQAAVAASQAKVQAMRMKVREAEDEASRAESAVASQAALLMQTQPEVEGSRASLDEVKSRK